MNVQRDIKAEYIFLVSLKFFKVSITQYQYENATKHVSPEFVTCWKCHKDVLRPSISDHFYAIFHNKKESTKYEWKYEYSKYEYEYSNFLYRVKVCRSFLKRTILDSVTIFDDIFWNLFMLLLYDKQTLWKQSTGWRRMWHNAGR